MKLLSAEGVWRDNGEEEATHKWVNIIGREESVNEKTYRIGHGSIRFVLCCFLKSVTVGFFSVMGSLAVILSTQYVCA